MPVPRVRAGRGSGETRLAASARGGCERQTQGRGDASLELGPRSSEAGERLPRRRRRRHRTSEQLGPFLREDQLDKWGKDEGLPDFALGWPHSLEMASERLRSGAGTSTGLWRARV